MRNQATIQEFTSAIKRDDGKMHGFTYTEDGFYKFCALFHTRNGLTRIKEFRGKTIRELLKDMTEWGVHPTTKWTREDFLTSYKKWSCK